MENKDKQTPKALASTGEGQTAAKSGAAPVETVTLQEPLRGGTLTSVQVRKPKPWEMRGLQLQAIVQGDVNSLIALLPKVTDPPLVTAECEKELDPADFIGFAGALAGFFYTKAEKDALAAVLGQIEPGTTTS
jgi:hypothetical protein